MITRIVINLNEDGLYTVSTESGEIMAADSLCRDEALGCVASWIYLHRDHGTRPQYMRTPEESEATRLRMEGMKS
jgi:hypothetical protein